MTSEAYASDYVGNERFTLRARSPFTYLGAIDHGLTLKRAALAKGVPVGLCDKVVIPLALTRPGTAGLPAEKGS